MAGPLQRLPFVTEVGLGDNARLVVNWSDAGFAALGVILTSLYSGIADIIGAVIQAVIIDPVSTLASGLADIVGAVAGIPAKSIGMVDSILFALETGYAGAILLVFVGAFVLAWTVQVIR